MRWEALYKEYSRRIYSYYLHMTGDHHLSEELTQETFFQALVSVHRFKGNSKVSTWLFGIARNVYLKHLRKVRTPPPEDRDINKIEDSSQNSPEKRYETEEENKMIYDVLLELPEDYRTVIVLREVEGLEYEEIGLIMGKSANAARVTLFRAKKRFREMYEARKTWGRTYVPVK